MNRNPIKRRSWLATGGLGASLLGMLVTGLAWPAAADTHYVVPPGTPGVAPEAPFADWATAGTSILEVVNVAMTYPAPRMVWVTNGTYYFTSRVDITSPLTLQSVEGWSKTIINGNAPNSTNSAFRVNITSGSSRGVIDGFTITNFGFVGSSPYGVCLNQRGTIQNCLITGNRTMKLSDDTSGGGVQMNTYTTMSNCIVRGNKAKTGGGIAMSFTQPHVVDTLVENNYATYRGGGVHVNGSSGNRPILERVTVINNDGYQCGGIYAAPYYNAFTINACVVTGNVSYSKIDGGGGGIFVTSSKQLPVTILNSLIRGNHSDNVGGGVYANSTTEATIRNCLIAENTSRKEYGGCYIATGIVESCTLANNQAATLGGGLALVGSGVAARNNIIYHNTAPEAPNYTNLTADVAPAALSYSCVSPAVAGSGNMAAAPVFKNAAGGNYRLRANSPCVDAGLYQDWMAEAMDLDGNMRVRGVVDIGAYEARFSGTHLIVR